jgi:hypothetical protein
LNYFQLSGTVEKSSYNAAALLRHAAQSTQLLHLAFRLYVGSSLHSRSPLRTCISRSQATGCIHVTKVLSLLALNKLFSHLSRASSIN